MGVFAPMGEVSTREQSTAGQCRAAGHGRAGSAGFADAPAQSAVQAFVTVLYIVVTVSFHKYDISGVFVMVLFPLVGYQVSMIPVHTCFHKLRVVMPLVCAVGLFNPFFDKQIVLYIGTVGVSGGVISMLTLMMKGIFCLMASFLLAATTSIEDVCRALRQLHVPKGAHVAAAAHVPVHLRAA